MIYTVYVLLYCCLYTDLDNMTGGVVMSPHFKTAAVYKQQPVTVPLLLDIYVQYFRRASSDVKEVFVTTTGTCVSQGHLNKGIYVKFIIYLMV